MFLGSPHVVFTCIPSFVSTLCIFIQDECLSAPCAICSARAHAAMTRPSFPPFATHELFVCEFPGINQSMPHPSYSVQQPVEPGTRPLLSPPPEPDPSHTINSSSTGSATPGKSLSAGHAMDGSHEHKDVCYADILKERGSPLTVGSIDSPTGLVAHLPGQVVGTRFRGCWSPPAQGMTVDKPFYTPLSPASPRRGLAPSTASHGMTGRALLLGCKPPTKRRRVCPRQLPDPSSPGATSDDSPSMSLPPQPHTGRRGRGHATSGKAARIKRPMNAFMSVRPAPLVRVKSNSQ